MPLSPSALLGSGHQFCTNNIPSLMVLTWGAVGSRGRGGSGASGSPSAAAEGGGGSLSLLKQTRTAVISVQQV